MQNDVLMSRVLRQFITPDGITSNLAWHGIKVTAEGVTISIKNMGGQKNLTFWSTLYRLYKLSWKLFKGAYLK